MSRLGGMMRSTRPKKLTPKQPIPIFRETQIDLAEDDPQTSLQFVDTGVEKAEEAVSVPRTIGVAWSTSRDMKTLQWQEDLDARANTRRSEK